MCEVIPEHTTLADILIVDDTPANLDVLVEMLGEQGYGTRPVPSGVLALQSARAQPPDLILLDINMPEMDGYEVCKHLKADDSLKDIPVIFISALRDTTDKVHAFDSGAVDYITKPFQFDEVKARVQTHLRTYRMQKQLEQQYAAIKKLEELKDNLTHMIVHDMASPIQTIRLAVDLVLSGEAGQGHESVEVLSLASDASRNLVEMVNSLLDISRMEAGRLPLHLTDADLRHLAEGAAEMMHLLAGAKNIRLIVQGPDVPLHVDANLVHRVFVNLIRNALKFTPQDGEVAVMVSASNGLARAEVRDTGIGIPKEHHERIFEKFGQVDTGQQRHECSFGLGLAFCRLAVVAHGGMIGVRSRPGAGSTFWFELPLANINDLSSEAGEQTSSERATCEILAKP